MPKIAALEFGGVAALNYEIAFAKPEEEDELREILIDCNMDLAGDIQEHVLIKRNSEIIGGGMLAQTGDSRYHLLVFAVKSSEQNRGTGSRLLKALLNTPWKHCKDCLEIPADEFRVTTAAKGNSAGFYSKNGFVPCEFGELAHPFSEQCTTCPDIQKCNPAAMVYTGHITPSLNSGFDWIPDSE